MIILRIRSILPAFFLAMILSLYIVYIGLHYSWIITLGIIFLVAKYVIIKNNQTQVISNNGHVFTVLIIILPFVLSNLFAASHRGNKGTGMIIVVATIQYLAGFVVGMLIGTIINCRRKK